MTAKEKEEEKKKKKRNRHLLQKSNSKVSGHFNSHNTLTLRCLLILKIPNVPTLMSSFICCVLSHCTYDLIVVETDRYARPRKKCNWVNVDREEMWTINIWEYISYQELLEQRQFSWHTCP